MFFFFRSWWRPNFPTMFENIDIWLFFFLTEINNQSSYCVVCYTYTFSNRRQQCQDCYKDKQHSALNQFLTTLYCITCRLMKGICLSPERRKQSLLKVKYEFVSIKLLGFHFLRTPLKHLVSSRTSLVLNWKLWNMHSHSYATYRSHTHAQLESRQLAE